jgi:hypothetical protein
LGKSSQIAVAEFRENSAVFNDQCSYSPEEDTFPLKDVRISPKRTSFPEEDTFFCVCRVSFESFPKKPQMRSRNQAGVANSFNGRLKSTKIGCNCHLQTRSDGAIDSRLERAENGGLRYRKLWIAFTGLCDF